MSAHYNAVEFNVADAIKSYLDENIPAGLPVVFTTEQNDIEYPCCFISEVMAQEVPEGTATYDVTIEVGIATPVSMPRSKHIEHVGQLMDLIFNDDLLTELSNNRAEGLIVQRVQKTMRRTTIDDMVRRTSQELIVMAAIPS